MIDPDVRSAVYQLHRAGISLRQISRQFRISRDAVRHIVRQQGAVRLPRARDWPLTAEDCQGMLMSWRCEAAAPEPAAGYDACNTGAVRRKKDDMKRLIADGSRGGRMEAG